MKRNRRIPVSLLSWMAAALLLTGRAAAASPGAAVPETESIAEAEQTAQTAPADTPESVGSSLPESGDTGEENPDEEEAELQGLFGWKSRPRLTVSLDGWRVGQAPNLPAVTGNAEDAPVLFVYRDAEGTIVPDIASAPAGEYTVTAFLEESEDYTAASARADFSITPAYMVTWRNADGTVLEIDKNVEPGALPHYDGPAPEKAGTAAYTYTFQGWDPAVTESGTVTGDTVFTAVFSSSLNRYPVDFLDDDGTVLRHAVYDYGTRAEDIVRPSAPVKGLTGEYAYTFQNWTPEIADVTGSAAYTAVYRRTPVQIYHPAESTRSYYSTLVEPCEGGTVQALPSESRPGTPVLLSVSPEDGYVLDVLIVRGLGRVETLGLTAAGENRTFVMPAFDVSVTASFRKLNTDTGETEETRTAGVETAAAQPVRENGTGSASQEPAETSAAETMQKNVAQSADSSSENQEASAVEQYSLVRTGFSDVSGGAYYARAVKWAGETGVLPGVSETAFAPDRPCTRAQMVLALWRASGSPRPASGYGNPFSDVDVNSPYYEAVLWALETGVTRGTTSASFSPDRPVTRAQAVTLLYRLRGSRGERTNPFMDAVQGQYFYEAALWACEQGITRGTTASTFSPGMPCTRAQAAAFLYRAFAG